MATNPPVPLRPAIQDVIDQVKDKNRLSAGIDACRERPSDFASDTEMELAGIAMVPEARQLMSDALTASWSITSNFLPDLDYGQREVIIGGGFHAAVYAANRVRMGFPRPVVLEQNSAERVGGAFAMSLSPVFRLNSRNRPGTAGLPDQDKALNYLPGGLLQPSMMTSEEYPTNADMAWLIRLTLAQYARVYTGVTVTDISGETGFGNRVRLSTSAGEITPAQVIDARGLGTEIVLQADGQRVLTFGQLMTRMGGMFPLRGMKQVAVIGAGDSGKCAVESLLGIAPGNTSAIGLDYVQRVDWYTNGTISGQTCSEFRDRQRGRYIRIAQYLDGNVSNPSTRLRVMGATGYVTAMPGGAIVNDRTYDMVVVCTGSVRPSLNDGLGYFPVRQGASGELTEASSPNRGTQLAAQAIPFASFRIGPAAALPFSEREFDAGIAAIPANQVAMFRLAPRTAALAAILPGADANAA
jgi:hypothetical protein